MFQIMKKSPIIGMAELHPLGGERYDVSIYES